MNRREFVAASGAAGVHAALPADRVTTEFRSDDWRSQFPALAQRVHGVRLVYLDSAATTLRPRDVIESIATFYQTVNANPSSTLHTLARQSSSAFDAARQIIARFIGADDPLEVILTRGTTEGINLVAQAWGREHLTSGDRVLIGRAEHSSNMVPWQLVARQSGAHVDYFDVDAGGRPDLATFAAALTDRTRMVAFSHVSNVLGLVNPVTEMCRIARAPGRVIVVDGAQSVPHVPIDVHALGCDFFAFSSHKMLGPMGVGVLWGRRELLDRMSPYQGGSNMAHDVDVDAMQLSDGALKYGAGTPNVSGAVGLAAAMGFLSRVGMPALRAHELALQSRMRERLAALSHVHPLGDLSAERISVFTFTVDGRAPNEVVSTLDARGIAVRAGDLASLPLLKRFGTRAAVRASAYLYTTPNDIDHLCDALADLRH